MQLVTIWFDTGFDIPLKSKQTESQNIITKTQWEWQNLSLDVWPFIGLQFAPYNTSNL